MSKFLHVMQHELDHLERQLALLEGRVDAAANRERNRLVKEWKGVKAALTGYRKSTRFS